MTMETRTGEGVMTVRLTRADPAGPGGGRDETPARKSLPVNFPALDSIPSSRRSRSGPGRAPHNPRIADRCGVRPGLARHWADIRRGGRTESAGCPRYRATGEARSNFDCAERRTCG